MNTQLKKISELTLSLKYGLEEVRIYGDMGEIAKAQDEYYRCKLTRAERAEKERELKALSDTSGPSGHQKLQVCDVCGAYLSRLDNDRRLADHFYGKMHLGYAQMRKTFEAYPQEMRNRVSRQHMDDGGDHGGDRPRGPRGGFRGGRGRRW